MSNRELLHISKTKSWKSIKENVSLFVLSIQVFDESLDGIERKENIMSKILSLVLVDPFPEINPKWK